MVEVFRLFEHDSVVGEVVCERNLTPVCEGVARVGAADAEPPGGRAAHLTTFLPSGPPPPPLPPDTSQGLSARLTTRTMRPTYDTDNATLDSVSGT